jgi:hypothetical protein
LRCLGLPPEQGHGQTIPPCTRQSPWSAGGSCRLLSISAHARRAASMTSGARCSAATTSTWRSPGGVRCQGQQCPRNRREGLPRPLSDFDGLSSVAVSGNDLRVPTGAGTLGKGRLELQRWGRPGGL